MDLQPLVRTKVTPAVRRADTLARPRLLDWLRERAAHRLSLITAEAGYGKTTLLADFTARSDVPCLWYQLDQTDRDWVTITNYLIAAVRELHPNFGAGSLALLSQILTADPSCEQVVGTFVAELAQLSDLRAVFILDDFHLVDDSEDFHEILDRLLRTAPAGLSFVIASRRRPDLMVARLAGQGELAELDTDALRFSREETELLFRDVYHQPLDAGMIDQIEARTEGWAATLQLLSSSMRDRSNFEIRALIRSLSGATGNIYDLLAEEVVRNLPPDIRRFVMWVGLLERIVVSHALAAVDGLAPDVDESVVAHWIQTCDGLGLMGRRGAGTPGHRFHPLLRDFLLRRLGEEASPDELRSAHRRIAIAAERDAWLTACHHYLEAGDPDEALRVLADALLVAAGTGLWGAAADLLERLPDEPDDPAVQVILAFREMHTARPEAAIDRLSRIDLTSTPPPVRSVARHALLRATWRSGDQGGSTRILEEILADPETTPLLRRSAQLHQRLMAADGRQDFPRTARDLKKFALQLEGEGLHYFAGVGYHNASVAHLLMADYHEAINLGEMAISEFVAANTDEQEAPSTRATLAAAELEIGNVTFGLQSLADASNSIDDADALAEAAYLFATVGDQAAAGRALSRAQELMRSSGATPVAESSYRLAVARVRVSDGELDAAAQALGAASGNPPTLGTGHGVMHASLLALCASLRGDPEAVELVERAKAAALQDGVRHWQVRIQLLEAVTNDNLEATRSAIDLAERTGHLALPEMADILVGYLDRFESLPEPIARSVAAWPLRWLPLMRRQLHGPLTPTSLAAARVLRDFGQPSDVPLLRAWERTHIRKARRPQWARELARRTSPPLTVRDLGRSMLVVGAREVGLAGVRRRSASLLLFLASRPSQTAAREQVLEAMWPELEPSSAANSLNQTLYFLRRDIEPDYEEAVSANYVHFEGELLWLDRELVAVESARFFRSAIEIDPSDGPLGDTLDLLRMYVGRFAPEFEYEDWAIDWRDRLHASYLRLVARAQVRLLRLGRVDEALACTEHALAVDPGALGVRRAYVWLLGHAGAQAAASEQFRRYAMAHREEVGEDPGDLTELLGEEFETPSGGRRRSRDYVSRRIDPPSSHA